MSWEGLMIGHGHPPPNCLGTNPHLRPFIRGACIMNFSISRIYSIQIRWDCILYTFLYVPDQINLYDMTILDYLLQWHLHLVLCTVWNMEGVDSNYHDQLPWSGRRYTGELPLEKGLPTHPYVHSPNYPRSTGRRRRLNPDFVFLIACRKAAGIPT